MSIESIKNDTCRHLAEALAQLNSIPSGIYGRDAAIASITAVHGTIGLLRVDAYLALKAQKGDTSKVFDTPVKDAIDRIAGAGILGVPHDLQNMLASQTDAPNIAILHAIRDTQKSLRDAHLDLRKLQSGWLRFSLGPWIIVVVIGIGLVFGACYFIFVGAGVQHPLESGGATEVIDTARKNVGDLKRIVSDSTGAVDAMTKLMGEITKLVSSVPTLVTAVTVAYAALRKTMMR